MADGDKSQALPIKPLKSFIACDNCKARKKRCDNKTPKCGNCVAGDTACNYATVRKTRGPGKTKKYPEGTKPLEHQPETTNNSKLGGRSAYPDLRISDGEKLMARDPRATHDAPYSVLSTSPFVPDPSRGQVQIRSRIPTLPEFLVTDQFNRHLSKLKISITQATLANELTPLLPQHIATRLIQNSFADIMAQKKLLDLSDFITLLNNQYIASSTGPAGNFARWAVVNAVTALALRFKAAPGSEADLSSIPLAFYHNATAVIHQLILQEPSLLSMQALLAMAMFAEDTPELAAFIMLGTNASRQLQLFNKKVPPNCKSGIAGLEQYRHICEVSSTIDKKIGRVLGSDAGPSSPHQDCDLTRTSEIQ